MASLVIVRHGQSAWNLENRFTGEVDVPLTEAGRREARAAGEKLKGISFSHGYTSVLQRAIETMTLITETSDHPNLPISRDKALNERNYGKLQGLNKADVSKKYGDEQVEVWRRSYGVRPPGGESLQDTAVRVLAYYTTEIEPRLKRGENILIVAHGNSLRSLMMYLEELSEEEIAAVNLPTGTPRRYSIDQQGKAEGAIYL